MARRMPRSTTTEEDIIAADATGEAATEVEEVVREEREEVKPVVESLSLLREAGKRAPRLFGIPSGVEGLDDLFGLDAPNGSKHPASETRIRQEAAQSTSFGGIGERRRRNPHPYGRRTGKVGFMRKCEPKWQQKRP